MNIESQSRQNNKQLPQNFKQNLLKLTTEINNQYQAKWLNNHTLIIQYNSNVENKIIANFDMSFKTFIKFIQMVGVKVQKINENESMENLFYKIQLNQANNIKKQQVVENNILKQLMQNIPIKQQNYSNYQQISIQVNLHRPETQLMNVEQELQFKDMFLKNFKDHTDSINNFIYQAIYQIFTSRESNRFSPCQIVELLTQLRDRIYENQKQLQVCIEEFKAKINTLNQQTNQNDFLKGKIILQKQQQANNSEDQSANIKLK